MTPVATLQQDATSGIVAGILPHPSANSIVATYSRPGSLRVYDLQAEKLSWEVGVGDNATLSSAAWNWDGSAMVLATQDQAVRILDPRVDQASAPRLKRRTRGNGT